MKTVRMTMTSGRLARVTRTGLLCLALCSLPLPAYAVGLEGCEEHVRYGAPNEDSVLLCRTGYALSHDPQRKVAIWVAYHLTREHMDGAEDRTEDFRPDADLASGERAELADYKGSGYDRGHMAPAEAMAWSRVTMSESFLLSNMAPQIGVRFNRHIWKALETRVRKWTKARGELYVVTGPVFKTDTPKRIGQNQIVVPTHFYKVLFDPVKVEGLAVLLPHQELVTSKLPDFVTSIDTVEEMTGLDFLTSLNDEVESIVEARKPDGLWPVR